MQYLTLRDHGKSNAATAIARIYACQIRASIAAVCCRRCQRDWSSHRAYRDRHLRTARTSAAISVVDPGFMVDPVHNKPLNQPHNPDQPR
jgi:hypothetical protein